MQSLLGVCLVVLAFFLATIGTSRAVVYTDGALLRAENGIKVFEVLNGKKRRLDGY